MYLTLSRRHKSLADIHALVVLRRHTSLLYQVQIDFYLLIVLKIFNLDVDPLATRLLLAALAVFLLQAQVQVLILL